MIDTAGSRPRGCPVVGLQAKQVKSPGIGPCPVGAGSAVAFKLSVQLGGQPPQHGVLHMLGQVGIETVITAGLSGAGIKVNNDTAVIGGDRHRFWIDNSNLKRRPLGVHVKAPKLFLRDRTIGARGSLGDALVYCH